MKANLRLSFRQITALIVLPILAIACGREQQNIQGDQSIVLGVEVSQQNMYLYDGSMSTVLVRQLQKIVNTDESVAFQHYECTGTVIRKDVILTAAHCLKFSLSQSEILVEFPMSKEEVKIVKASNVFMHEDYTSDGHENDLMLLKLETDVPKDYLPMEIGKIPSHPLMGSLYIFGFGRNSQPDFNDLSKGQSEPALRTASPEYVGRVGSYLKFDQRNGGGCLGDSGGPLVHKSGYKPVIVGVAANLMPHLNSIQAREVEYRYKGDLIAFLKDNPSVDLCRGYSQYTDLSQFEDWIKNGIRNLEI